MDDLPSLDFDTHRAISQILTYSRQPRHDVADLSLDWFVREEVFGEIVSRNLRPGEKTEDDVVEQHDVLSYCLAVAEHHLIKRRKVCDEAFFHGVRAILNPRWLRLINSSELTLLTCGEHDETFDVEDMRKHTLLQGGYDEGSKTIKMFWNVVSISHIHHIPPTDYCSVWSTVGKHYPLLYPSQSLIHMARETDTFFLSPGARAFPREQKKVPSVRHVVVLAPRAGVRAPAPAVHGV